MAKEIEETTDDDAPEEAPRRRTTTEVERAVLATLGRRPKRLISIIGLRLVCAPRMARTMVKDESRRTAVLVAPVRTTVKVTTSLVSSTEAVVALKQGAGRLIRHENDVGLLVVCDTRLHTMGYGRRVMAALPPMQKVVDDAAVWAVREEG